MKILTKSYIWQFDKRNRWYNLSKINATILAAFWIYGSQ